MIKFIHLKDFQSHKDTTLNLHPLFNIIVGPSGNGKSSIIRALRCLSFNHIGSAEVRLPDAKSYHIEVGINDHTIEKDKGAGVNSYTIDKNTTLVDVNKDVPSSVQQILNIKKVELDSSCDVDVQFSSQLDGPFMLSEKDSVKMKFLNTLSGTNAVDLAAKRANAIVKDSARTAKSTDEELKKLRNTESALKTRLADISQKVEYLKKAKETIDELEALRDTFLEVQKQSNYLFSEYKKLHVLEEAIKKINVDELSENVERLTKLKEVQNTVNALKSKYISLKKASEMFDSVSVSDILDKMQRLGDLISLKNTRDSLKTVYLQQKLASEGIETNLKNTIDTYISAVKEQKACPVCGNSITPECIDKIINSL